jgi:uncharacterized protein YkwD
VEQRLDRLLILGVVGLGAVLVLALAVTRAAPSTSGVDRHAAALMLDLINAERAGHDLAPLTPARDVAGVAEAWSETMATIGDLQHNPDYGQQFCCWSIATENVAWSEPHRIWFPGDPVERITRELHAALLASPGHRVNLLDPDVDHIGIGVYVDRDGAVWITQNFRRYRPT